MKRQRPIGYSVYRNMLQRCYNPRYKRYADYGGRGITVCPEWRHSFANFWLDMSGTYKPGLTLDRRDNNGNYSPDNCRWITLQEQLANRRCSITVDSPYGRVTLDELARLSGINRNTLASRYKRGSPLLKARYVHDSKL